MKLPYLDVQSVKNRRPPYPGPNKFLEPLLLETDLQAFQEE